MQPPIIIVVIVDNFFFAYSIIWVHERARGILHDKLMFYVLNKKKIKVLNFWVPERARVIHHDKKQLYVLNFEYAKPGTLRDKESNTLAIFRKHFLFYDNG